MITKTIELRDKGTFIPCVAIRLLPSGNKEQYLIKRAGYGNFASDQGMYVLFGRIQGGEFCYNPERWLDRTFKIAHEYVTNHFDELVSGEVIDVEYILGEKATKKESEAWDLDA